MSPVKGSEGRGVSATGGLTYARARLVWWRQVEELRAAVSSNEGASSIIQSLMRQVRRPSDQTG